MKLVLSFIIFLTLVSCNSQEKQENRGYIVEVGDQIPNIEFQLTDGSTTTLNALKGKVVVLQFTASWCSVCRKEMPHLEKEVWQRFKDDEFIANTKYGIVIEYDYIDQRSDNVARIRFIDYELVKKWYKLAIEKEKLKFLEVI